MHTTGIPDDDAELVFRYADVSTGCASKYIRQRGTHDGVYRVGDSVPIFGITPRGRDLIEERIEFMGRPLVPKPNSPQPDRLL